jgi:hypothetical protein
MRARRWLQTSNPGGGQVQPEAAGSDAEPPGGPSAIRCMATAAGNQQRLAPPTIGHTGPGQNASPDRPAIITSLAPAGLRHR